MSGRNLFSRTVFVSEYLEKIRGDDELAEALEAEMEGPWRIEKEEGHFVVLRQWERLESGHRPVARLRSEQEALVLAALLPALGREVLYRLRDRGAGYILESAGEEVGEVAQYYERVPESLHLIHYLLRSPRSLAYLFRAAGPTAQELVGQMLAEEAGIGMSDGPTM